MNGSDVPDFPATSLPSWLTNHEPGWEVCLMLDALGPVLGPVVIILLIVAAFLLIMGMASNIYVKVGPNEALIVYGLGGTQIVTGSGKFVVPLFQSQKRLSLELMTFDVAPQQDLFTNQGVAV